MFCTNEWNSNQNNVTRNNELFSNYRENVTKVIQCKVLSLNVYLRSQINAVILCSDVINTSWNAVIVRYLTDLVENALFM